MLSGLGLGPVELAGVALVAFAAGTLRGFSGFGTALVLAPVLSVMLGPRTAVPAIVLSVFVTTAQLVPSTWRHVRWRDQLALSIPGCLGVPAGVALLVHIEPDLLRRGISAATAVFALVLMTGWRYSGRPSVPASGVAGLLGGVLSGAGSIGGPPVVAYLLAGPDPAATNRASFVYYFVFTQTAGIALFAANGLLTWTVLAAAVALVPPMVAGLWLGARLFARARDAVFRRVALAALMAIALATLVA